jgi:hypothetical protein
MEDLPLEDSWSDMVISNGVLNLAPDKSRALAALSCDASPGTS